MNYQVLDENYEQTAQRQLDKCQFLYKATLKRVDIMYSTEAVKTVIFTSLNEWSPQRSSCMMVKSPLLKIFSSVLTKGTICGGSYECQYGFFEKCQTLRISYIGI